MYFVSYVVFIRCVLLTVILSRLGTDPKAALTAIL